MQSESETDMVTMYGCELPEFPPEFPWVAQTYHEGQGSMLYAVASTGDMALNAKWAKYRGDDENRETLAALCDQLAGECRLAADVADRAATEADARGAGPGEGDDPWGEAETLAMAAKVAQWRAVLLDPVAYPPEDYPEELAESQSRFPFEVV